MALVVQIKEGEGIFVEAYNSDSGFQNGFSGSISSSTIGESTLLKNITIYKLGGLQSFSKIEVNIIPDDDHGEPYDFSLDDFINKPIDSFINFKITEESGELVPVDEWLVIGHTYNNDYLV